MINKRYLIGKKLGQGRSKVFNVIEPNFLRGKLPQNFYHLILPVKISNSLG